MPDAAKSGMDGLHRTGSLQVKFAYSGETKTLTYTGLREEEALAPQALTNFCKAIQTLTSATVISATYIAKSTIAVE